MQKTLTEQNHPHLSLVQLAISDWHLFGINWIFHIICLFLFVEPSVNTDLKTCVCYVRFTKQTLFFIILVDIFYEFFGKSHGASFVLSIFVCGTEVVSLAFPILVHRKHLLYLHTWTAR